MSVWGDLCWHCHILCCCWHHTHPSSPCPGSHLTMRTPLHWTAIRPRYTHSHLSITRNKEGIIASRVSHIYRHLACPSLPRDIRKPKDFFLLHIQWTIELLYKDNMSIVFCEMRRTMGVSGEMAVPVSRVLATMSQYSGWGDHRYQWGHVMPEYCHTSPVIQRQDHTYIQQLILTISTTPSRYLCY